MPRSPRGWNRRRPACARPRSSVTPARILPGQTVRELESLGILGGIDERTARSEIHRLGRALDAVEQLQSWIESRLELSAA